jgi:hypothetical protein
MKRELTVYSNNLFNTLCHVSNCQGGEIHIDKNDLPDLKNNLDNILIQDIMLTHSEILELRRILDGNYEYVRVEREA